MLKHLSFPSDTVIEFQGNPRRSLGKCLSEAKKFCRWFGVEEVQVNYRGQLHDVKKDTEVAAVINERLQSGLSRIEF